MRLREFLGGVWGIPIPGTEKAVGLKKAVSYTHLTLPTKA